MCKGKIKSDGDKARETAVLLMELSTDWDALVDSGDRGYADRVLRASEKITELTAEIADLRQSQRGGGDGLAGRKCLVVSIAGGRSYPAVFWRFTESEGYAYAIVERMDKSRGVVVYVEPYNVRFVDEFPAADEGVAI